MAEILAIAAGALVLVALAVFFYFNWPSALERQIAARYLRSRLGHGIFHFHLGSRIAHP